MRSTSTLGGKFRDWWLSTTIVFYVCVPQFPPAIDTGTLLPIDTGCGLPQPVPLSFPLLASARNQHPHRRPALPSYWTHAVPQSPLSRHPVSLPLACGPPAQRTSVLVCKSPIPQISAVPRIVLPLCPTRRRHPPWFATSPSPHTARVLTPHIHLLTS